MNKSYISPTKLSCLALVCMITALSSLKGALILTVIVGACFVLGIAIVSNLEKITSHHVRFVIYALIISAIMTVIKIVFGHLTSIEFVSIASQLDYAVLAGFVLAIMPMYFMHKTTNKSYYAVTIKIALTFTLIGVVVSSIIEFVSTGSIMGLHIMDISSELLGSSFLAFILIAVSCIIGTSIENYSARKKAEERLLIDKYKYIIRESQIAKLEKRNKEEKTKVFDMMEGNE